MTRTLNFNQETQDAAHNMIFCHLSNRSVFSNPTQHQPENQLTTDKIFKGGRICGTHTFKELVTGRLSRLADENSFKRAFKVVLGRSR
jgi:hypothetical protein|tara:strand:+ start:202 stop:465 length:264 start_codon:yes stop_codon:yes gene_type:complete